MTFALILYSPTSNSILDKAIDSEDEQHNDFLRLVGEQTNSVYFPKLISHKAFLMPTFYSCRSTLKDIMNYLPKQKLSLQQLLRNGMLSTMSRWMMMSMSILVCTSSKLFHYFILKFSYLFIFMFNLLK